MHIRAYIHIYVYTCIHAYTYTHTYIRTYIHAHTDPVFGPMVMLGIGGIYAEVMKDIAFAEAPVSRDKAKLMISSLKSKDIFLGARGQSAVDIDGLIDAIVNLSNFIAINSDKIDQVEMNPILVSKNNVIALDALIITKSDYLEGEESGRKS